MNENILACASCQKSLLHWFVTNPNKTLTKIRANCPFCGDKSFITEVYGKFAFGPIGLDERTKSVTPTRIVDINYDNDFCEFKVEKNV